MTMVNKVGKINVWHKPSAQNLPSLQMFVNDPAVSSGRRVAPGTSTSCHPAAIVALGDGGGAELPGEACNLQGWASQTGIFIRIHSCSKIMPWASTAVVDIVYIRIL